MVLNDSLIKERIESTKIQLTKSVFPGDTNHHDTMFGGSVMYLMNEVAFMTATRFSRKTLVTVSSNKISFENPIPAGTIIQINGEVCCIGKTSIDIKVEVILESMYQDVKNKVIEGIFTLVAINENKRPINILDRITYETI